MTTNEQNSTYNEVDTRIALMMLANAVNEYACLMTASTKNDIELQNSLFQLRDTFCAVTLLKASEINEQTSVRTLMIALDIIVDTRDFFAELRKLENTKIDSAINALKRELTRYQKVLNTALAA